LQRPQFGWTQEQVDGAIRGLSAFAEHVEPKQRIDAIDVARRLAGSAMVSD
jgi:hypothetical protein